MLEGLTVPDYAKALGRPEVARELRGFSFRNVTKTGRAGQLIREVFALSPPGGEDMKEFRTRAEKYLKVRNFCSGLFINVFLLFFLVLLLLLIWLLLLLLLQLFLLLQLLLLLLLLSKLFLLL